MKNHISLLPLLLLMIQAIPSKGQAEFHFFPSISAYTALESSQSINQQTVWDDDAFQIPIGFDFQFLGKAYSMITLQNGNLYFNDNQVVAPLGNADLQDRGVGTPNTLSPISYQVSGEESSRVFKIEVHNAGFFDGYSQDSISYQIWLVESTNAVEIHYGTAYLAHPSLVFDGNLGPNVQVGDWQNKQFSGVVLSAQPKNPICNNLRATTMFDLPYLRQLPQSGVVYELVPNQTIEPLYKPITLSELSEDAYLPVNSLSESAH